MRLSAPGLVVAALAIAGAVVPGTAAATTFTVTPGHSIQAAVDSAHKGDTVAVKPGTYKEAGRKCPTDATKKCAVVVRRDGIRLVAQPKSNNPVVLARKGTQYQGIAVARTGDAKCLQTKAKRVQGSLVKGFTVKNFAHDGVFLFCVDGWHVTGVRAIDNAEYGVFPSHVGQGQVDHSFATGSNDTGIYIGQSHDVRINLNTATKNVSGFEIENSRNVRADHNEAFGNTAGILSFLLPNLDVKVNRDNVIENNNVHGNNKANTCANPSDIVCKVPSGSGILVVGADRNKVRSNTVAHNKTIGIGVASYCIISGAMTTNCTTDIEPNPDHDRIRSNNAVMNGANPDPSYAMFASDLGWDTTGTDNCWAGNTFGKSFPASLPAC